MYYYFITVEGNDKCVATSPTYSASAPVLGNCLNELDYPSSLSAVGQGQVICNNLPGAPPRGATVYSDGAAALVAVPEGATPRAAAARTARRPAKSRAGSKTNSVTATYKKGKQIDK